MLDVNWGWLFVGAALGWLIEFFMDRWWWSKRRICTDDEIQLRGEVDVLGKDNLALKGQISGFDTERGEWNTRFASQETRIDGFKSSIGGFETENSSLKGKLSGFETDNASLRTRIGKFETANADLQAKLGKLEADNGTLQTKIGKFEADNKLLLGNVGDFKTASANLKGRLESVESEKLSLQGKLADFETTNASLTANLGDFETERASFNTRIGDLETTNATLTANLADFEAEKSGLQARIGDMESGSATLEADVAALRGERDTLKGELNQSLALRGELDDMTLERDGLHIRMDEYETEIDGLKADLASSAASADGPDINLGTMAMGAGALGAVGLAAAAGGDDDASSELRAQLGDLELERDGLHIRLDEYEEENASLKAELANMSTSVEAPNVALSTAAATGTLGLAAAGTTDAGAEVEEIDVVVAEPERDDLKKIWGIGPASERVLNANGIYTFAQLCKADSNALADMLTAGGHNAGLFNEETWPEQACLAADGKMDELKAMQASAKSAAADDLKVIHGIGPKSESVLHDNSIYKYTQLAKSNPDDLTGMLTAADMNAALLNEETWPDQARLVADGKMDELAEMQNAMQAASADKLQLIHGVGPKSEKVLHSNNIYKFTQLAKSDAGDLGDMLTAADMNAALLNEETWPDQARLAADGKMDELAEMQAGLKIAAGDDLKVIHGVGPASETVLHNNSIYKYSQLAKADPANLAEMLTAADMNAALLSEETWPEQARLAAAGKMDELATMQAGLKSKSATESSAGIVADSGADAAGVIADDSVGVVTDSSAAVAAGGASVGAGLVAGSDSGDEVAADNLQDIWGIGPASETVLRDNNISSFAQLSQAEPAAVSAMLAASGGTFSLVREETWPAQAALAAAGNSAELATMQESLAADYVKSSVTAPFEGKKDDLTKIWGIGPAVQKVLFSKGIYTFTQLAGTQLRMLEGIIAAAGDRFNLVRPELWIPQAELAAAGDMDGFAAMRKKISLENR